MAAGIDGDQTNDDEQDSGAVYVFTRLATGAGSGEWSQMSYLKADNPGEKHNFGSSAVVSGDGNTIVVGASREDSSATGMNGDRSGNPLDRSGAAYTFVRNGDTWATAGARKSDQHRAKRVVREYGSPER